MSVRLEKSRLMRLHNTIGFATWLTVERTWSDKKQTNQKTSENTNLYIYIYKYVCFWNLSMKKPDPFIYLRWTCFQTFPNISKLPMSGQFPSIWKVWLHLRGGFLWQATHKNLHILVTFERHGHIIKRNTRCSTHETTRAFLGSFG